MATYAFILPAWVATHAIFWTSDQPFLALLRGYLESSAHSDNPGVVLLGARIDELERRPRLNTQGEEVKATEDVRFLFLIEQAADESHLPGKSYLDRQSQEPEDSTEAEVSDESTRFIAKPPRFRAVVPASGVARKSQRFNDALKDIPGCTGVVSLVVDGLQAPEADTLLSGVFRATLSLQLQAFQRFAHAKVACSLLFPLQNRVEDWDPSPAKNNKKKRSSILSTLYDHTIGRVQRHPWRAAAFALFAAGVAVASVFFPPLVLALGFVAAKLPIAAAIATGLVTAASSVVGGLLGIAAQRVAAAVGRSIQRVLNKNDGVVVIRANPVGDRLRSARSQASYSQSDQYQLQNRFGKLAEEKNQERYLNELFAIAKQVLDRKIYMGPRDFYTEVCALLLREPVRLKGSRGFLKPLPDCRSSSAHEFLEYFKGNDSSCAHLERALQQGWVNCDFCPQGVDRKLPPVSGYVAPVAHASQPVDSANNAEASMYSLPSVPSTTASGAGLGDSLTPLGGPAESGLPSSSRPASRVADGPAGEAAHRPAVVAVRGRAIRRR